MEEKIVFTVKSRENISVGNILPEYRLIIGKAATNAIDMKDNHILTKTSVRCALSLLCCMLWGSAFPCIKLGFEWLQIETVGEKIMFAGYRFLLAGLITFAVACLLEKRIIKIQKPFALHILGLGVLNTTMEYVCFYIGMSYITGTKGSIIDAASTFISILMAHFLIRGERLTWRSGLGCIIGFAGIVIINMEGITGGISFMGEGMMLISMIIHGACTVFTKPLAKKNAPMTITAYQMAFGSVFLILIGFAAGGHVICFDGKSALLLVYMAVLSATAFSVWTLLLKYNEVGKVAIFGFSIPVFGMLLSSLLLGEAIFTFKNIVALICVSAGIIIVNLPQKRKKPAGGGAHDI